MIKGLSVLSEYLLSVLRAVLEGHAAPPPPEGLSMEELFAASETHGLSAMVWYGLYGSGVSKEELAPFAASRRRELIRAALQDRAIDEISEELEKEGVVYCPVKGFYTRQLYPEPSMRSMSDVDILIHDGDSERAKAIMDRLGYECLRFRIGDDDKYKKKGLLIEFHRGLDADGLSDPEHYADPWRFTEPVGGMRVKLKADDAYLYTAAHAKKHFMHHGAGLRTLIDVYLSMTKETLDREYVEREAGKMGISKFLKCMERLAAAAFADGSLEPGELEVLRFMLSSGVLGNEENYETAKLLRSGTEDGKISKGRYFFKIVFPPLETMKKLSPMLENRPWLLPFAWIERWFRLIFRGRDRIESGLSRFDRADKSEAEKLRGIYKTAGIDE